MGEATLWPVAGSFSRSLRLALGFALLVLAVFGTASSASAGTGNEVENMPLRDSLIRSENPLSNGGKWAPLAWASSSFGGPTGQATSAGWATADPYPTVNGAYWTPQTFTDKPGASVSAVAAATPTKVGQYQSLWLNMTNPGGAKSGYQLRWRLNDASKGSYDFGIVKWVEGTETVLTNNVTITVPNGTLLGLTDTGSTLTVWRHNPSPTAVVTTVHSITDSTYSSGYVGFEGSGGGRLTNFRAGSLYGPGFSEMPVRDALQRSEFPLAKPDWTQSSWTEAIGGVWNNSQYKGYGGSGNLVGVYWNKRSFNDELSPVAVAATVGSHSAWTGEYMSLWLNAPSPGTAKSGYELRFTGNEGSTSNYTLELSKWVAGTRTVLATQEGIALAVGTTLALSESEGHLIAWTSRSGSLSPELSVADSTYSSGYAGMDVNGGGGTLYDFKAGNIMQPPNTFIEVGSSSGAVPPNVGFYFYGAAGTTKFECSLDGSEFSTCTSPKAYSGLSVGNHTFRVRAVGAIGPDETPAESTVQVVSPETAVNRVPLRDNFERNENPLAKASWGKLFWTETIGGVWWNSSYRGYGSPGGDAGAYWKDNSFNITSGTVVASAIVGNASSGAGESQSLWLNTFSPGATKNGLEARYEGIGGGQYKVTLSIWVNGTETVLGTASNVTLPVGSTFGVTKSGSALSIWSNAGGSYSEVLAVNQTGRPSGYAGLEVDGGAGTLNNFRAGYIDITAPDTLIFEGPSGTVTSTTATFIYTSSEAGSTFECTMDSAKWETCPASYSNLATGSHTFRVRAVDPAGNADATPAQRTFTVQP